MSQKNNREGNYSGNVNSNENTREKQGVFVEKNMQKTIWTCFFGIVSVIAIALSVYFNINYKETQKAQVGFEEYYKTQSINNCRRSMFNISDGLQNADANMGKLLVSNDKKFITDVLIDMEGIAQSSVADLSYIPIKRDIAICCAKYFNQLGDYCKSLTKSVEDRGSLTEEQKDSIKNLRKVGNALQESINSVRSSIFLFRAVVTTPSRR